MISTDQKPGVDEVVVQSDQGNAGNLKREKTMIMADHCMDSEPKEVFSNTRSIMIPSMQQVQNHNPKQQRRKQVPHQMSAVGGGTSTGKAH